MTNLFLNISYFILCCFTLLLFTLFAHTCVYICMRFVCTVRYQFICTERQQMQFLKKIIANKGLIFYLSSFLMNVSVPPQVCAGPLVQQLQSNSDQKADSSRVHTLKRIARMTPLWRIMNSKPFGAYCQNNYECSTGLCR